MSVRIVPAIFQATIEDSATGMSLAYSAGKRDARTWAEQGVHLMGGLRNSAELEVHLLQVLDLQ